MWIFGIAILMTLGLAVVLLAVVAIGTGHYRSPRAARWEHAAQTANRHMNGQGTPPRVLARLDAMHEN